jgi:hypothetical protein
VSHWRQRFIKERLTGLADALGRGCKRHQAAPDPEFKLSNDVHLSSSWLNLAERFFRDPTDQTVSGSFASVKELPDRIFTWFG